MMSMSSVSSMNARTMGRSPEIPWAHSAESSSGVSLERFGGRAQRGIGVEDASWRASETGWLRRADAEMAKLNLGLRPGEGKSALEGGDVAMLVGQFERLLACGGHHGGENDARGGAGRNAHGAPQAHDRIEHRANHACRAECRRHMETGL